MTDAEYCPVCGRRHLEHRLDCPMGAAQERIKHLERALLDLAQWAYCTHNPGRLGWEYHQASKVLGVTGYDGPNRVERLEAEVARLRPALEACVEYMEGLLRPLVGSMPPEKQAQYMNHPTLKQARAALSQDAPREGE